MTAGSVRSGGAPGEKLVVEGSDRLSDGIEVQSELEAMREAARAAAGAAQAQ